MLIHLVAGARPNFMKIAPLYHALRRKSWAVPQIIHTGQHYDVNMSEAFFRDLHLPEPDIHLGAGSGSHAAQTAQVMVAYEKVLLEKQPDLVIVVGDVNSTMAATLTAVKLGIKVAHLEAGLRSGDRTMPEEINRLVTDALADILWTPSPDADQNLLQEGVPQTKIIQVGNIMIDSLEMLRDTIEVQRVYQEIGVQPKQYVLVTLHRPFNVDHAEVFTMICRSLSLIAQSIDIVFPVHPRTRKNMEKFLIPEMLEAKSNIHLLAPQSYIRFMNLAFNCRLAITDSGGIQEETSYLGIPCLTLRPNTERPITITKGTNRLCSAAELEPMVNDILNRQEKIVQPIDLWDGRTAERIVDSIACIFPQALTS